MAYQIEHTDCPAQLVADAAWNKTWKAVRTHIEPALARRAASIAANKAAIGIACTCGEGARHYAEH